MLIKDLLEGTVVNIPTILNAKRILQDYKTSPYYPKVEKIPDSENFIQLWDYYWTRGLDRYLKNQGLKNSLKRIRLIQLIKKDNTLEESTNTHIAAMQKELEQLKDQALENYRLYSRGKIALVNGLIPGPWEEIRKLQAQIRTAKKDNTRPVEEGFLDYFKKKPNIAQRRKKWLELWQEYKDQSYRFGDPQQAFSAFSEKLKEIIKKEFPVYSEKIIGRLARKEAEIALRTDNPQWDGWGLGPQSATSELAPGERGFKKPEPRKFRDREIPPANPNQMNLDLDEVRITDNPTAGFQYGEEDPDAWIGRDYGAGLTGINRNIDYEGYRVSMKPSKFLALSTPLPDDYSSDVERHLAKGGSIGAPFLYVTIPEDWTEQGKFTQPAAVTGHEGRHRMRWILRNEGDDPVAVHMVFRGGLRRRHVTDQMMAAIKKELLSQKNNSASQRIVTDTFVIYKK